MSDGTKQVIKYQDNVESVELLELADKVLCEPCHMNVTAGHFYCIG